MDGADTTILDPALLHLEAEAEEAFRVSSHGALRARQRLGVPKRAVEREVARALLRGKPRTEFSGRMRRTLDYMFHRYGHFGDYRVWNGHIFVFKGDVFVTVLPLTHGLQHTKAAGQR